MLPIILSLHLGGIHFHLVSQFFAVRSTEAWMTDSEIARKSGFLSYKAVQRVHPVGGSLLILEEAKLRAESPKKTVC